MTKYRVWFRGIDGKQFFYEVETEAEVRKVRADEKAEYIKTECMEKRSVICSFVFLAVAIMALLADFNITLFVVCLSLAWMTLTEEIKQNILRIIRLEA